MRLEKRSIKVSVTDLATWLFKPNKGSTFTSISVWRNNNAMSARSAVSQKLQSAMGNLAGWLSITVTTPERFAACYAGVAIQ